MKNKDDYKDFREKPYEILEKGQHNEMVLIKAIPRAIRKSKIERNIKQIEGILELGEGNFMPFFGKDLIQSHLGNPITYLKAFSESNHETEFSGIYNSIGKRFVVKSVDLGNLGEYFFNTKK